jgi:hypothetical protein
MRNADPIFLGDVPAGRLARDEKMKLPLVSLILITSISFEPDRFRASSVRWSLALSDGGRSAREAAYRISSPLTPPGGAGLTRIS